MTNLQNTTVRRIVPLFAVVVSATCLTGADWLQFRGNDISGVSALSEIPATWSDSENVAWKVDLPGRGLSGVIVIGDQVVVTASGGFRQDRLHVLAFDRASGKKNWERQFWATGRTMTHQKMCVATPTPASDGKRIFAFYSSNDVVCLDLGGNLQWLRGLTHDFPNASNSLGMSSSPIVIGDTLIVQVENDAESFATGLDTSNGKARWKKVRPKKANWTSPTLWQEGDAEPMALLQSSAGIEAVEPRTGKTLWKFGDGASTIPSSVVTPDSLLVPSNGLTALRLGEKLDDEEGSPEVLWNDRKLGPGTSSPIVVNGKVFVVNRAGVLQCADVNTGSLLWRLRLKGPFSATPVAAGKHLIFFNEKGDAQVVDISGAEGEIVGENSVGETILSTPAIADNEMFVRSDGHLWKIAK